MSGLEEAVNASPALEQAAADYAHVRRAIAFLGEHWKAQPSVSEIADHVGLSQSHLTHLFRRWAGISPKAFLQAMGNQRVSVKLKWGMEYTGRLISADTYMNLQLADTEEFVDGAWAGNLGEVLIRCNNVLYVRKAED